MIEIALVVGTACALSAYIGWRLKEVTDEYEQKSPHWGFSVQQQKRDNDWFRENFWKEV